MKKIISSLRSAAALWMLALLVLASLSGVAYGKYVGRKDVATGLTLTVQPREYRLISGSAFNALTVDGVALKSLPKPIVFDVMKPEYESLIAGLTPVPVAEELTSNGTYTRSNQIRLYNARDKIYVLGDGEIKANPSCAGMFSEFSGCTGITFHSFNTSRVTNMSYMFENCEKLETIEVTFAFVTDGVSSDGNMFKGCDSLVGGAGTTYNSSQVGKLYARIDIPPNTPGYFTAGPGILVRSAPAKVGAYVNFEGRGIEVNPAS